MDVPLPITIDKSPSHAGDGAKLSQEGQDLEPLLLQKSQGQGPGDGMESAQGEVMEPETSYWRRPKSSGQGSIFTNSLLTRMRPMSTFTVLNQEPTSPKNSTTGLDVLNEGGSTPEKSKPHRTSNSQIHDIIRDHLADPSLMKRDLYAEINDLEKTLKAVMRNKNSLQLSYNKSLEEMEAKSTTMQNKMRAMEEASAAMKRQNSLLMSEVTDLQRKLKDLRRQTREKEKDYEQVIEELRMRELEMKAEIRRLKSMSKKSSSSSKTQVLDSHVPFQSNSILDLDLNLGRTMKPCPLSCPSIQGFIGTTPDPEDFFTLATRKARELLNRKGMSGNIISITQLSKGTGTSTSSPKTTETMFHVTSPTSAATTTSSRGGQVKGEEEKLLDELFFLF